MLSAISGISLVVHLLSPVSFGQPGPLLFEREEGGPIYSINPDGSNLIKWVDGVDPVRSPDGQFTLVNYQGNMLCIPSDGGVPTTLGEGREYTWSPDGEHVAFQRGGIIYMIGKDGSGEKELAKDESWRPVWSPTDPNVVYYNRGAGLGVPDFYLVDVTTGELKLVRAGTFIFEGSAPFSPEGTRLLVSDCGDESFCVKVLDLATGELTQIGFSGRGGAQRPAWSPDANYILFETFEGAGGLFVADSGGQTVRELVPGRDEAAPSGAVWSPGGDVIAFHMRKWTAPSSIYLINVDGTGMRRLAEGSWPLWISMPLIPLIGDSGQTLLTWGALKYQFGP